MASYGCSCVCLLLSGMGLCLCVYIVNIGCGIICGYFYRRVCYGCGKDYLYFYMYIADTGYGILCVQSSSGLCVRVCIAVML